MVMTGTGAQKRIWIARWIDHKDTDFVGITVSPLPRLRQAYLTKPSGSSSMTAQRQDSPPHTEFFIENRISSASVLTDTLPSKGPSLWPGLNSVEETSALLRLWRPLGCGRMVPKSGDLEILFDGDGVSGSPEADRGLPAMSRVVLGGVVGIFSTMMDGISRATERP
jgi:hypothetical protein